MYSSFTVSKSGNTLIIIIFGEPTTFNGGGTTTYSLDGVWRDDGTGMIVTINGSTGIITQLNTSLFNELFQSAVSNGYIKVGDQYWRNFTKTGDLTWTGQLLGVTFKTSAPNVATGVTWGNCTIILAADGQTLTSNGGTWTRQ
jgi:hypothetical protein